MLYPSCCTAPQGGENLVMKIWCWEVMVPGKFHQRTARPCGMPVYRNHAFACLFIVTSLRNTANSWGIVPECGKIGEDPNIFSSLEPRGGGHPSSVWRHSPWQKIQVFQLTTNGNESITYASGAICR